jgi:hypothetical protein
MPTLGFKNASTGNLLIAAIIFTFLFLVMLYARMIKFGFVLLLVTALLWTVFAEEVRLEKCNARCPAK